MLPRVKVQKVNGGTGVVRPSEDGVLAVIAPAQAGTQNMPVGYTRGTQAQTDFGNSPLAECIAYVTDETENPVLAIRPTCSTAASYGSITTTGAGSSTITAGTTAPDDDYPALVVFTVGGTIGDVGILYTTSLDGGETTSAVTALGTANTLTIPSSGVSFALGAGTILANETVSVQCTGARSTNSDLVTALEALRVTQQAWEAVLIYGDATSTTVSTVDTWLTSLQAMGMFRSAVLGARLKEAGESEATYATAMQTAFGSAVSDQLLVCADGALQPQPLTGLSLPRSAALFVAARGMSIDIATDPAYVDLGPIDGVQLDDDNGNPVFHDEQIYPGLDDQRLTTLRSFPGNDGVYITNANILHSSGSDYTFWQYVRVMNNACEDAFQLLTKKLSLGVQIDNNGHITETSAQGLESYVQEVLEKNYLTISPARVSAIQFTVSRDDDLSSNGPGLLTCTMQINGLRYIKQFQVNAGYVSSIAA